MSKRHQTCVDDVLENRGDPFETKLERTLELTLSGHPFFIASKYLQVKQRQSTVHCEHRFGGIKKVATLFESGNPLNMFGEPAHNPNNVFFFSEHCSVRKNVVSTPGKLQ